MELIDNIKLKKLRGGFYTPPSIALFILNWGTTGNIKPKILEPSCGDGVFLKQVKENKFDYKSIVAIEIDSEEASKANLIKLDRCIVIEDDFHHYCNVTNEKFDLIVGNPPYIRYQSFNKEQRKQAEKIFSSVNLKYSKLTNAWVSFVIGASLLLKEEGKIGFVVPAELLQVSYAQQLRQYLARFYNKINIISFKHLVFKEVQQEVVLLLCEKSKCNEHYIEHIEIKDERELSKFDVSRLRFSSKKIDFNSNKWTYYFLEQAEISFLNSIAKRFKIKPLSSYAKVEVGITTGANNYFVIPKSIVDKYKLHNYVKPLVGRSFHVNSLIFTKDDWIENQRMDARANLLIFSKEKSIKKDKGAFKYIQHGELIEVNKRYKTSIRDDWYIIPSVRISMLYLRVEVVSIPDSF